MKNKVFTFIIGLLIGAIIASAGFLIFGGNKGNRSMKDFDPSQFQNGDMTPPDLSDNNSSNGENRPSRDSFKKDKNSSNTDTNNVKSDDNNTSEKVSE